MTKGHTLSDLHLFCNRSRGAQYTDAVYAAAAEGDFLVLNGDIVDFRWSRLPGLEDTVAAGILWLERLLEAAPNCHVHYVLGNHDHVAPYVHALEALAQRQNRFAWTPYYLRLGENLFFHGDVAHLNADPDALERARQRWEAGERKRLWVDRTYDLAFALGVHRGVQRLASPVQRVIPRLHYYLERIGHGRDAGVANAYFGHTHVPLRDHSHRGVQYHNAGAPFAGINFGILPFYCR